MTDFRGRWMDDRFSWLDRMSREKIAAVRGAKARVAEARKAVDAAVSDLMFAEAEERIWSSLACKAYASGWNDHPTHMKERLMTEKSGE